MTANLVIAAYCNSHHRVVTFVQKLSDEQLCWQLNNTSLSITWHVWHVARWADYFQASVSGMTPELGQLLGAGVQIWHREQIAQKWDFDSEALGYAETGMNMPDTVATYLVFPPKDVLMGYIARVFAQAEKTLMQVDSVQFECMEQPQPLTEGIYAEGTVGNAIMAHLTHINRHLGMMECLLGLQGISGTSTR